MTRRKTIGLIASLALTAALAAGVVWVARSSGSGGEAASPLETPTPTVTALLTPEPGTPTTLTPMPSATPVPSPAPLPPPDEGYVWYETPENDFGFPLYAVQIPAAWVLQTQGNPNWFAPVDSTNLRTGPTLITAVTPVSLGYEHPILFNLPQMGTTCGTGVPQGQMPGSPPDAPDVAPATQFAGDLYTWNVYFFSCSTRLTAPDVALGKKPILFDVRAAEVQVGELILSVTAFEPPRSAAAQAVFEQALLTLTLQ
jgi:hypothetical protein